MIKSILYATDLNPFSVHVLSYAMDIAVRFGGVITVVHALCPEAAMVDVSDVDARQLFQCEMRGKVSEVVAEDMLSCDVGGVDQLRGVRVEFGSAVDVILLTAREEQADLVVMGSHGYQDERRLLGSVVQPVLMASRVPVVVVPMPQLLGVRYRPTGQHLPLSGA